MELSESLENYLETIYHIVNAKGASRAKDIAVALQVNNSSVTEALKTLSAKGLVNYKRYDLITLTDEGKVHAQIIVNRHEALERFLTQVLGLEDDKADAVACRIEHIVDEDIIEKLNKLTEYLTTKCTGWHK